MGYHMAVNLRSKIGQDKELLVCDVNKDVLSRSQTQVDGIGPIRVIENGFEAIQHAVIEDEQHI